MSCACLPSQNAVFHGVASTSGRSNQLVSGADRLPSSSRCVFGNSKPLPGRPTAALNYLRSGFGDLATKESWGFGVEERSRVERKRSAKSRDYQDFENATHDADLERSVEVLDVFDSREPDLAERPERQQSELLSSEALPEFLDDQKLARVWKDEPYQFDELMALDGSERTSDLKEVGKIYEWLKSKGKLANFGKYMSSASMMMAASEGDRLVSESTLLNSIGLTASKLSPKKWGVSGSSAIPLVIAIALFSVLEDLGMELRPAVAVALGLGFYDAIYLGGTGLTQLFSIWLPYQRRVLVHEAGHVLVAYLLGCPIRGVILNPMQAAKSGIQGQAGTQFWDKTLEMELRQNRLSSSSLDRYSTVLFAGIAAEAFVYGEAQGGENDENMFKSFVSQIQPSWSPAKMSNQARWAVLHAFQLIKKNREAHAAVVEALKEGGGLSSLVRAIEGALV